MALPPDSPAPQRVVASERKQVLAASAPWLGALLNVLPGLGSGYLYQRRWRAWWWTATLLLAWLLLADERFGAGSATALGWLTLGIASAGEAFLAGRKARHD